MAFLNDIQSNTPERYRFKLVSATNEIICKPQPLEWKSGTLNIKRDLEVGGVFSSFQQDSLTFVSNGAQFLRNLYEAYELNAKCTLIIYWWKSSLREYVEFPTRFDINFNFYETVKIGKFAFGVKIKAINNSTQTKLDNRQDINVDITKLTSIGGVQIVDYPAMKKSIFYDATNIFYSAELLKVFPDLSVDANYLNHIAHQITYTSLPLTIYKNDNLNEVQNVVYRTNIPSLNNIQSFFKNAKYDYELDIDYYFLEWVSNRYVGSFPWQIQIIETKETGDLVKTTEVINTYDLAGFGGQVKTYDIRGSVSLTLTQGNDLKLVVLSPGIDANYRAYSLAQSLRITNRVIASPESNNEGFPIYEAIERNCQHILDVQYPFYSNFFGRPDVSYDEFGSTYPTENQLRFAHVQSGMNQRGVLLSDKTVPLAVNFKDLFASIKAIWNVGYMLDSSIDGMLRVRIEEYAYFFQDVQILDLSGRVGSYDIESQVMPELVPVDLKSGFDSYDYLTVNGRAEPNTTCQRTSIMNTASKFENISKYRGDTKGIFSNIANSIATTGGTTDTTGDDSIFIVKTQRYGDAWKPEKGENITIEDDTSLFRNDLLNRYFTPSRMLIRHGNKIKAGMTKYLESVLAFQKSDKANNLKTTGEGFTLTESDDIFVSNLADPIYKPMKHTITCRFDFTDLEAIQQNSLGYIKFSDTISGFLLSLKKKNNEDKAEISIIERYAI